MAGTIKRGNTEMKVTSINFEVKELGHESDRTLRFIGSDETPDRDGDVISVNGWDLKNYVKNPVFLWAHDYSIPPIGRALNVYKDKGKLMFDIQFPEKGVYPFADLVYNLYKGGFMNATSVGFVGKEAEARDDKEVEDVPEWRRGVKFTKQELLELSAVPVPSNPSAIQQAKSLGMVSDDVYNSLMGFINGEFVNNNEHIGVKTMKGIKSVFESTEKEATTGTETPEVKANKTEESAEPETEKQTPVQEEGEKASDQDTVDANGECDCGKADCEYCKKDKSNGEGETSDEDETDEEDDKEDEGKQKSFNFNIVVNPSSKSILLLDTKSNQIVQDITEQLASVLGPFTEAKGVDTLGAVQKAGAVLSKQNKTRLSQASDLIIEVLSQVENDDTVETEEKDASNTTEPTQVKLPEESNNTVKSVEEDDGEAYIEIEEDDENTIEIE